MKLNREGVQLSAEERNKRNQNWATLEVELEGIGEKIADSGDAKELAENVQAQVNALVVQGDSSVEARQARVDAKGVEAATLKARLDAEQNAVTQQLAEKVGGERKASMEDLGQDVKEALTGGSVAVVGPGVIGNINVQSKAIAPDNTTFIQTSTNLFDKDSAAKGFSVDVSGVEVANADYHTSGYIKIDPKTKYTKNTLGRIAFYSSPGVFISSHLVSSNLTNKTVESPENAVLAKVAVHKNDILTAQFNRGEVVLPFEPYYIPKMNRGLVKVEVGKNDLDKNAFSGRVVKTSPQNSAYEINFIDKYIDFKNIAILFGGTRYYVAGTGVGTINIASATENQTYLLVLNTDKTNADQVADINTVFTTKIQNQIDTLSASQMVIGAFNPVTHEVYGLENITIVGGSKVDDSKTKYPLEITSLIPTKVIQSAGSSGSNINAMKSADIFSLYDSTIVSPNSGYVEKKPFFTESSGLPSYRYDFKPQRTEIQRTTEKTKRPHFFLISGIHPAEKAGWWSLYNALNRIANEWKTDPKLRALRWGVDLSVIPMVNVYGLDNNAPATNANQVDINRNYTGGWFPQGTIGEHGYGGASAGSEIETKAIMNVLANEKVDYFGDFHNFFSGSNADSNKFIWNIGSNMFNNEVAETVITHLSQKWKEENPSFPQDENVLHGYVAAGVGGSSPGHCAAIGVNGSIFEVRQQVMFEPNPTDLNSTTITLGTDAIINWLYQMYRNTVAQ